MNIPDTPFETTDWNAMVSESATVSGRGGIADEELR